MNVFAATAEEKRQGTHKSGDSAQGFDVAYVINRATLATGKEQESQT